MNYQALGIAVFLFVCMVFVLGIAIVMYSLKALFEYHRYQHHKRINPNLQLPVPYLSDYEAFAGLILGSACTVAMGYLINQILTGGM